MKSHLPVSPGTGRVKKHLLRGPEMARRGREPRGPTQGGEGHS